MHTDTKEWPHSTATGMLELYESASKTYAASPFPSWPHEPPPAMEKGAQPQHRLRFQHIISYAGGS